MKECDILGEVKAYSDPSYIFFQGIRTPNPHDLRPCTVPTYSNHTFLQNDQTRWKYFSTGPTSPRSRATMGKSSLHLMSTSQMCTLSPHISRMLTRDLFAVANLVRYSGQTWDIHGCVLLVLSRKRAVCVQAIYSWRPRLMSLRRI